MGVYLYYWTSIFKKLGTSSIKELNEEEEEELVDESQAKFVNYFGSAIFITLGLIIWTLLGVTVGKISGEITDHYILRWFVYFAMFFLFLRMPFSIGNKMVKNSYDFEKLPEAFVFFTVMLTAYVFSICCFDALPRFLKWHLYFM